MRRGFVIRLLVNAAALWVATRIVTGVEYDGGWLPFLGVALIFGVVNASIGRITKFAALPLIVLSLGLFLLVVNGLMLWLTSAVAAALGLGFHVHGFGAAFWGALVVSVVSALLWLAVGDRSRTSFHVRSMS
jgi:putative membrane protein